MNSDKELLIKKASGNLVPFSKEKLIRSLCRSGASEETASEVATAILPKLYPGISTRKIHRFAHNLLKRSSGFFAARYRLKKAIMEMGPTGFPFENFIAAILRQDGYAVKKSEIIEGKCVRHEIDVIAVKGNRQYMIECKYHNQQGIICDVKIPLYIQARFKDIEATWKEEDRSGTKFHQGWVATNTRFSQDAMQYGTCAGLYLLGWDYPVQGSLKERIDRLELYPVTCLSSLSKNEKRKLLEANIILCKDLPGNKILLQKQGISEERIKNAIYESEQLCSQKATVS